MTNTINHHRCRRRESRSVDRMASQSSCLSLSTFFFLEHICLISVFKPRLMESNFLRGVIWTFFPPQKEDHGKFRHEIQKIEHRDDQELGFFF